MLPFHRRHSGLRSWTGASQTAPETLVRVALTFSQHQHASLQCQELHIPLSGSASPHLVGAIHAIGNAAGAPQALRECR